MAAKTVKFFPLFPPSIFCPSRSSSSYHPYIRSKQQTEFFHDKQVSTYAFPAFILPALETNTESARVRTFAQQNATSSVVTSDFVIDFPRKLATFMIDVLRKFVVADPDASTSNHSKPSRHLKHQPRLNGVTQHHDETSCPRRCIVVVRLH